MAVMDLPAMTGAALIIKAQEAEKEEQIRAEWTALLPWMQTGHLKLIQFNSYLEDRLGKNVDTRPAAEIIAELEELHGGRLV